MSEQFSRWDPVDHLQSEEDMAMYLDACLEEDPCDGSLVRAALNDIARAQGMTHLAKATGITREGLYKALSPAGNPAVYLLVHLAPLIPPPPDCPRGAQTAP